MTGKDLERNLNAHTPNANGTWHELVDHLQSVAKMARIFGEPLGIGKHAYYAGLWHDLGKASCLFQCYLAACEKSDTEAKKLFPIRDHKLTGVSYAALKHRSNEIAFAIEGHHGGLTSKEKIVERVKAALDPFEPIERIKKTNPELELDPPELLQGIYRSDELTTEMGIRFLTSCLVDADFLDTEMHFSGRPRLVSKVSIADLLTRLNTSVAAKKRILPKTAIDLQRSDYLDYVVGKAKKVAVGIYQMSGSTGIGKTLTSMSAALQHAQKNSQQRIIFALPYMTVTEQTASVFRDALGDDNVVLEHHSGTLEDDSDDMWARLASENWDAPVVVTTTVQLFESLFARSPSKLRKLHNMANAVIIIDEAQTIPLEVLEPALDAIKWLSKYANTTVVFMTATQPAWEKLDPFKGLTLENWGYLSETQTFKRVNWTHQKEPLEAEEVANRLLERNQALCVVNSIKDSLRIWESMESSEDCFYLSTRLCKSHRREVLEEIKTRLFRDQPCRVVSTQLIEAGIDLDFPVVWRALAPLPSIAQAAGRCNRNARIPKGEMVVFDLEGSTAPPGNYRLGIETAQTIVNIYQNEFDPENSEQLNLWFAQMYRDTQSLDAYGVNNARKELDYLRVAYGSGGKQSGRFRIIDDDQVNVVVAWGDGASRNRAEDILNSVSHGDRPSRSDLRFLSQYSVGINKYRSQKMIQEGKIQSLERSWLMRWIGIYDNKVGLSFGASLIEEGAQW